MTQVEKKTKNFSPYAAFISALELQLTAMKLLTNEV